MCVVIRAVRLLPIISNSICSLLAALICSIHGYFPSLFPSSSLSPSFHLPLSFHPFFPQFLLPSLHHWEKNNMSCFRPASFRHLQGKIRHRTRRKNDWIGEREGWEIEQEEKNSRKTMEDRELMWEEEGEWRERKERNRESERWRGPDSQPSGWIKPIVNSDVFSNVCSTPLTGGRLHRRGLL